MARELLLLVNVNNVDFEDFAQRVISNLTHKKKVNMPDTLKEWFNNLLASRNTFEVTLPPPLPGYTFKWDTNEKSMTLSAWENGDPLKRVVMRTITLYHKDKPNRSKARKISLDKLLHDMFPSKELHSKERRALCWKAYFKTCEPNISQE